MLLNKYIENHLNNLTIYKKYFCRTVFIVIQMFKNFFQIIKRYHLIHECIVIVKVIVKGNSKTVNGTILLT